MLPTLEQVLSIDPHIAPYADALIAACGAYDIVTPTRQAMFFAQTAHESGGFRYTKELWGPTPQQQAYEPPSRKSVDLGNTTPGDGFLFRGRGLIQITGRANYAAYSKYAYGDDTCVLNPDLLKAQPDTCASAAWFWKTHNCNALADLGTNEAFIAVTKRINGGTNGLEDRQARWAKAQVALGIE